ncbi:hypothetical protein [Acetivibrio clariflavus]|uniref:hypothetical protein n=1 Tax=Acetivibrio clariflavus TaxID=288965 RepID=UPI0004B62979|nr:hypothetical protein [Acetivibrio clariflavus]
MKYRKADVLIVIMGTNPFPNLVSAATRVKIDGYIYCICSEDTAGKPYEKFKNLLQNKGFKNNSGQECIKKYLLTDDEMKVKNIESKVNSMLDEILRTTQGDILIELNYTCGKKIMSSVAYDVIKNKKFKNTGRNIEINLIYIDAERELMYVEQLDKRKVSSIELCDLEESFELSVVDIIETYNTEICEFIEEPKYEKLSNKLGEMFESISYIKDKREQKERYKKLMDAKKCFTEKNENNFIDKIKTVFENFNLPVSMEDIDSAGFEDDEKKEKYFEGNKWFEEYILSKLLPLKEEKIIDGLVANVKRKSVSKENEFEVDIVLYKKYKMYALSLTTTRRPSEATPKLYEIFQRSTDLAGDETERGLITLFWVEDVIKLKEKCMNLWDDDLSRGVFITGVMDLPYIKEKVKNWICGGEKSDQ